MIGILDSNSLSVLKNYYPASFPSLWNEIAVVVDNGTFRSVREVYNELHNDNRAAFLQDWAKDNRAVFAMPSDDELQVVTAILAIPHFQSVISTKAMLKGTPVADPFVVASAAVNNAVVITEETRKPNAAKIPNICEHFGVEYYNLEWFMTQQGWKF